MKIPTRVRGLAWVSSLDIYRKTPLGARVKSFTKKKKQPGTSSAIHIHNAFTTENLFFFRTILPEVSRGRDFGALKGVERLRFIIFFLLGWGGEQK